MSKDIILTCPHCGNKTLMKLLHKYEKETSIPIKHDELFQASDTFEVFECPVCGGFNYSTFI